MPREKYSTAALTSEEGGNRMHICTNVSSYVFFVHIDEYAN